MAFDRSERVAELLQREISLLLREVKDPGVSGLVTVTGLKLARDRKSAMVFYSVLGSREQKDSTAKALERAANFLRHELRDRVKLRSVPKIAFAYDPTPERAQRIEEILVDIEKERDP
ncbi:MAG: 30S ribosome-binding factor RbfA [Elusimicrobia bacterium]|nr:30S ribosome-binding factor RbfA [Elusimicrobiota bacterium]